jgi:hypothetical protein
MYNLMYCLFKSITEILKVGPFVRGFRTLEVPLTHWKFHIEAVYFKRQDFYQRNLYVNWNYKQSICRFFTHTFIRMLIFTTHIFQKLPVCFSGELMF